MVPMIHSPARTGIRSLCERRRSTWISAAQARQCADHDERAEQHRQGQQPGEPAERAQQGRCLDDEAQRRLGLVAHRRLRSQHDGERHHASRIASAVAIPTLQHQTTSNARSLIAVSEPAPARAPCAPTIGGATPPWPSPRRGSPGTGRWPGRARCP